MNEDASPSAGTALTSVSRRQFLRVSTAAAAGAMALPLLLQACGGSAAPASSAPASTAGSVAASTSASSAAASTSPASSAASSATAGGALKMPTYVPFQGPTPDIAGNTSGLPPAYFAYPKAPVKSVASPPGKSDDVSILTFTIGAPPPAMDQNSAWQEVNKEVGAKLNINAVGAPDYLTKLTTIVAGGNLPDLFYVSVIGTSLQNMPQFLESQCADLTPYLAGDAVKAYPNLANFPSFRWPYGVFNNKILAVPAADATGQSFYAQGKALDAVGVTSIKDKTDFLKVAKELTQAGKVWAMAGTGSGYSATTTAAQNPLGFMLQVFRVPNDWRNDGGKLTKDIETPEFKEALAYTRGLWDAGVMHPNSPSLNLTQLGNLWYTGKVILWQNSYFAFGFAWDQALQRDPAFSPRFLQPFAFDGGKAEHLLSSSSTSLVAVKRGAAARVQELLGVLDFTVAPFGSTEAQLLTYGVQGKDFAFDPSGAPALTPKGRAEVTSFPIWRFGGAPTVIYDANGRATKTMTVAQSRKDFAQITSKAMSEALAIGVKSPVVGLYSPTAAQKGQVLNQKLTDGLNNIVYGRADVNSFDQIVKDWQTGGGNDIRNELEKALQASTA
ncbi:MAG TPA: extracellular solute-binding protein [Chloroflexota bacterium]|nr:extracellular solute-binding protein [Chloroflexota bacterium]